VAILRNAGRLTFHLRCDQGTDPMRKAWQSYRMEVF